MLRPERPEPLAEHVDAPAPPANTTRMRFLANRFLGRLTEDMQRDIAAWLTTHRCLPSIATACSGTDSPVLCMTGLVKELQNRGFDVNCPHVFSCELDAEKRRFLQAVLPQATVFCNSLELASGRATMDNGVTGE
eukprot:10653739-Lingulodinium_polyedra.AAC.1